MYSDPEKHNLSVINTKVLIDKDKKIITKFVKHNCCSVNELFEIYLDYLSKWSNYKYFMPTEITIENEYIVINQKLHGISVLEDKKFDLSLIDKIINPIIELCIYAKDNKLYADPHIKNFTVIDDIYRYVDISPPYSNKYNNYVINKAKSPLERHILQKNCEYFRWDWLPYHFAGDLLSIDFKSIIWFDLIYEKISCVLPKYLDKESFLQKAISVRYYEDKRNLLGFNLL